VKREEPSTESPSVMLAGPVVCGTPPVAHVGTEVLLIEASPRVGVRPLQVFGCAAASVSGVGLFGNAALSGW